LQGNYLILPEILFLRVCRLNMHMLRLALYLTCIEMYICVMLSVLLLWIDCFLVIVTLMARTVTYFCVGMCCTVFIVFLSHVCWCFEEVHYPESSKTDWAIKGNHVLKHLFKDNWNESMFAVHYYVYLQVANYIKKIQRWVWNKLLLASLNKMQTSVFI